MPKVEQVALDHMVATKLMLDRAADLKVPESDADKAKEAAELDQIKADPDFEQHLKTAGLTVDELKNRIHEQYLIGKVLQAEALKDVDPTEQEINAAYLAHQADLTTPPEVRVSRILIHLDDKITPTDKAAKKKIIDAAHTRVAHGEDFSKVAMQVSEDRTSAPQGGDLGFFSAGQNEPEFDDVAFKTKEGAVSPVFETPLGYQFIKVTGTQPAGVVPLDAARDQIASILRQSENGATGRRLHQKVAGPGWGHLSREDDRPVGTGSARCTGSGRSCSSECRGRRTFQPLRRRGK